MSGDSPVIAVFVGNVQLKAKVVSITRVDLQDIYGERALNSGFFISLKHVVPEGPAELNRFFRGLRIEANGKLLWSARNATVPQAFRWKRTKRTLLRFGDLKAKLIGNANVNESSKDEHYRYVTLPSQLAEKYGKDLIVVSDKTPKIKKHDILIFTTIRNEYVRLPYFLQYYRAMGVNHFIFVDNDSTDEARGFLASQEDCSLWTTKTSYKEANFGVHWTNSLLKKFGVGHWCLTLDPDEFFVFPYCKTRGLRELLDFLDSEGQDHMFCLLLDMYSAGRVSETISAIGQDPLEVAPYFDGTGYTQQANASYGETFVQGGPRRRVFFKDQPEKSPAMNKTPLVKWRPEFCYLSSTHVLSPAKLNWPHPRHFLSVTGCLLHFKFLSVMAEKASEEIERKEHYEDSIEYEKYHNVISAGEDFLFYENSLKYTGPQQLAELGYLSFGRWF
ncbi:MULTISPECIES: glycosyltransferase family 2 protein [Rhizobium]|uniref:Glycosyltransferase family 2 protein n=1 Tax=Rhizobium tropici TaxID=398 RepID=A0A6P1CG68_RHITR|nr:MULTISPECIES: glycosyltransferase family 2 protein [Rhizobium]MBB4245584.1 hypothetical protein [Rhizobium tropici]MBB5596863.1 hypothetical protein [Rhizobium tropici]MBB6495913.1 hypothetical protein [Rhizobium tropici]NEV15371.1 glycosyltransferase family 2 protein [Rhizobium tropici]TGE87545.1 glycosyltransferase family 2 protein [Rhizobium sp. SEMIA 4088]